MAASVRLASAPINWGIETPDHPGNPSIDEVLQNSVEAGYQGFELGPLRFLGPDALTIGDRLEAFGLKPVAYWMAIPLAQPFGGQVEADVHVALGVLHALTARHLLISDFGDPERMAVISRVEAHPETWWSDDDWAEARKTFQALAALGKDYGVDVSLHPHVGGHIESPREIEKALEAIDGSAISVCIDTGHIRIGGTDAIPLMRRLGSKVHHIHAKDVDASILARLQRGEIDYAEAVGSGLYCDLGSGMVDWPGLAEAADAIGYRGWVVAEEDQLLSPGRHAPFESNIANRAFLAELFGIS